MMGKWDESGFPGSANGRWSKHLSLSSLRALPVTPTPASLSFIPGGFPGRGDKVGGTGALQNREGRHLMGVYWTVLESGRSHTRPLRRKKRGGTGMEVTVRCGWTPFFLGPHPSFLQNEHSCQTTQLQLNYSPQSGSKPLGSQGRGQAKEGTSRKTMGGEVDVTFPSWHGVSLRKNEISTLAFRLGSIRDRGGETQGTGCLPAPFSPGDSRATGRTGLRPGGHPKP